MTRIFLNGKAIDLPAESGATFLGRALLERFHPGEAGLKPPPGAPPYLFCGNGACRDCDLLVEGLPSIPSCRIPLAEGLSLRVVPGTALGRRLPEPLEGEPLVAPTVVVGAGPAGRAAAAADVNVARLEARAPEPMPVGFEDGSLVVFERGRKRRVRASTVVLATGARDRVPARSDVLPMDLVERYVEREALPRVWARSPFVLVGDAARVTPLLGRLRSLGAESVTSSTEVPSPHAGSERGGNPIVVVGGRREPSLELARALGCKTRYHRRLGSDVLVLKAAGETSVPGIFATGDAAMGAMNAGGSDDPT